MGNFGLKWLRALSLASPWKVQSGGHEDVVKWGRISRFRSFVEVSWNSKFDVILLFFDISGSIISLVYAPVWSVCLVYFGVLGFFGFA